jgi:hypothetical protein
MSLRAGHPLRWIAFWVAVTGIGLQIMGLATGSDVLLVVGTGFVVAGVLFSAITYPAKALRSESKEDPANGG